jgi:hypothetical protein
MKTFYCSVLLILFFVSAAGGQSPTSTPSPEPSPTPNSISLQDYRGILENERKLLDEQSEKYYARIDSLMNRIIWGIGLIGVAALGLIGWRFGKTRKELEGIVHEQVKNQATSLVDADMKALRASVESDVNALRSSIKELEAGVARLQAYQNQMVVWVFSGPEPDAQAELDALRATGLENIYLVTPANDETFDIGEADLVILSFDGTDEGRRRLGIIVNALRDKTPPVSLVIYTYNPGGPEIRLQDAERTILGDFRWYVPVNFPTTLVAQTQLLIRSNPRNFKVL